MYLPYRISSLQALCLNIYMSRKLAIMNVSSLKKCSISRFSLNAHLNKSPQSLVTQEEIKISNTLIKTHRTLNVNKVEIGRTGILDHPFKNLKIFFICIFSFPSLFSFCLGMVKTRKDEQ